MVLTIFDQTHGRQGHEADEPEQNSSKRKVRYQVGKRCTLKDIAVTDMTTTNPAIVALAGMGSSDAGGPF